MDFHWDSQMQRFVTKADAGPSGVTWRPLTYEELQRLVQGAAGAFEALAPGWSDLERILGGPPPPGA